LAGACVVKGRMVRVGDGEARRVGGEREHGAIIIPAAAAGRGKSHAEAEATRGA
jgi:hypothetical protein